VTFPKGQNAQYSSKDISSSEILIANLVNAYRRWRLHNGTFESYYQQFGREALIEFVQPWWSSWAQYWSVHIHGAGYCDLYTDIRTAKGSLSAETIDAIKATVLPTGDGAKETGLIDLLVSRYDEAVVENCGSIWNGTGKIDYESISDITNWVLDCEKCEDETSYTEPSGFIYHLDKSETKKIIPDAQDDASLLGTIANTSANTVSTVAKESMSQLSGFVHLSTFGYFGAAKSSSPIISEQIDNNGPSDDLTESKFLVGYEGTLEDEQEDNENNTTTLHQNEGDKGSDFLSENELYNESLRSSHDDEGRKEFSFKKLYLELASTDTCITPALVGSDRTEVDDTDPMNNELPDKRILKSFTTHLNIVVYRRRPFIFVLFFEPNLTLLSDKKYYQILHRKLASLTEPIYADLAKKDSTTHTPPDASQRLTEVMKDKKKKSSGAKLNSTTSSMKPNEFYYHVYDPNNHKVQTSLPDIPMTEFSLSAQEQQQTQPSFLLNSVGISSSVTSPNHSYASSGTSTPHSGSHHESAAQANRLELIHVHQSMVHISQSCARKSDFEKFIRTNKGWWVYWSKLPDNREVVFARKWTKPGKPPMNSSSLGLLGVLGNDTKGWVDDYRYFGKV